MPAPRRGLFAPVVKAVWVVVVLVWPLLKWIVNIRQSTSGGDYTLARGLTAGTGPDPYLNVNGAGYGQFLGSFTI